ncbi:hypothetical protein [Halorarum salinum]|uniref:DUF2238 domain-containing protein n=1 Tax=Halorarum salinum TaxID=2743089 RepID=A0A7D5QCS1_9EURY|nr:hypothetical protein [Halobaculum salinum]QLG62780.1 hypothetical protein HUG12_14005 [Halobaculum salinum]
MVTTRPLVTLRGLRAEVAWLLVVVLVACAVRFLTLGELDWAVFVALVVAVAVVPPAIERDPAVTMPWPLLALVSVPVLLRAAGVVSAATPFLVMAGLALLAAIALDSYTSLALTPRFSVVFVIVTTMAFAAVWTVGTWASDVLLGTEFVGGQTELMWDIVAATGAGVVAGFVFEAYFRLSDRPDRPDAPTGDTRVEGVAEESDDDGSADDAGSADDRAERSDHDGRHERPNRRDTAESKVDLPGDRRQQRWAVHAMRSILALIAVVGAVQFNVGMFLNGAVTLAVTFAPALLRREYGYPMGVGLTLWVTAAVGLHAVGVIGPYRQFGWYDSVAHALSATLIAGIGYALARAVELHTDAVDFQPTFRSVFVVLFVLAAGVAWELLEFASGGVAAVFGGRAALAQYGTGDIVNDLAFNAAGGVLIAVLTVGRFEAVARSLASRVGVFARNQ